jgi:uncharacterized protein (DUF2147 family)
MSDQPEDKSIHQQTPPQQNADPDAPSSPRGYLNFIIGRNRGLKRSVTGAMAALGLLDLDESEKLSPNPEHYQNQRAQTAPPSPPPPPPPPEEPPRLGSAQPTYSKLRSVQEFVAPQSVSQSPAEPPVEQSTSAIPSGSWSPPARPQQASPQQPQSAAGQQPHPAQQSVAEQTAPPAPQPTTHPPSAPAEQRVASSQSTSPQHAPDMPHSPGASPVPAQQSQAQPAAHSPQTTSPRRQTGESPLPRAKRTGTTREFGKVELPPEISLAPEASATTGDIAPLPSAKKKPAPIKPSVKKDGEGRVTAIRYFNGAIREITYGPDGSVCNVRDKDGTNWMHQGCNLWIQFLADGKPTGNLWEGSIAVDETGGYIYEDSHDKSRVIENPDGTRLIEEANSGSIEVDAGDRVTKVKYLDQSTRSFSHDEAGELIQIRDKDNSIIRRIDKDKWQKYDAEGRAKEQIKGSFHVDTQGNLVLEESDTQAHISETLDGKKITRGKDGYTVTQHPDGTRDVECPDQTQMRLMTDGTIITTTPDGSMSQRPDGTRIETNTGGAVVRVQYPNKLMSEFEYDASGELSLFKDLDHSSWRRVRMDIWVHHDADGIESGIKSNGSVTVDDEGRVTFSIPPGRSSPPNNLPAQVDERKAHNPNTNESEVEAAPEVLPATEPELALELESEPAIETDSEIVPEAETESEQDGAAQWLIAMEKAEMEAKEAEVEAKLQAIADREAELESKMQALARAKEEATASKEAIEEARAIADAKLRAIAKAEADVDAKMIALAKAEEAAAQTAAAQAAVQEQPKRRPNTATVEVDDSGKVVCIQYPNDTFKEFQYSQDGELIGITDETGKAMKRNDDSTWTSYAESGEPLGTSNRATVNVDRTGNLITKYTDEGTTTIQRLDNTAVRIDDQNKLLLFMSPHKRKFAVIAPGIARYVVTENDTAGGIAGDVCRLQHWTETYFQPAPAQILSQMSTLAAANKMESLADIQPNDDLVITIPDTNFKQ